MPESGVPVALARPPGPVGLQAELADFFAFVKRPRLAPRLPRSAQPAWRGEWLGGLQGRRLACWVLLLWTVNLAALGPLAASVAGMVGAERRLAGMPPWLLAVVWAPIIEEMVFRFGLRRPALASWLAPILVTGLVLGRTPGMALVVVVCGLTVGAVLTRRRYRWPWSRNRAFVSRFAWIFHGMTLAFACLHLLNFNLPASSYWLLPLLILPQWVTGLVLGWMRVRFGIGAAIMLHALFNAGPMLLLWALLHWRPGLPI